MPPGTGPFAFKDYKADAKCLRAPPGMQKGLPYLMSSSSARSRRDPLRSHRSGRRRRSERKRYGSVPRRCKGNTRSPGAAGEIRAFAAAFKVVAPPSNIQVAGVSTPRPNNSLSKSVLGLASPDQLVRRKAHGTSNFPKSRRREKVKAILKNGRCAESESRVMGLRPKEELKVIQSLLTSDGIQTKVTILERGAREKREDAAIHDDHQRQRRADRDRKEYHGERGA